MTDNNEKAFHGHVMIHNDKATMTFSDGDPEVARYRRDLIDAYGEEEAGKISDDDIRDELYG